MNSRTVRDFSVPTDIWPSVENWAETEGFHLIKKDGSRRRYEKIDGSMLTVLELIQQDENIHMETWLHASFVGRMLTLFTLSEESALESSERRAVVPRTVARDSVNRLLIKVAQPLIT